MLASVSAFDVVAQALGQDLMSSNVQFIDAIDLDAWLTREPFGGSLLDLVPSRPMLVSQVYSKAIASSVKLALTRVLPDEHEVVVVTAAGVPGEESVVSCPLHDLDHQPVNHLTSVWVPPLPILSAPRSSSTLHHITATLRAPDGCPWDRKQSHATLRDSLIEEAHEVVDAIDEDDSDHLAEELGDLLLQVALHTQIAEEAGEFTIEDVYDHVNRKLVRRHPHVFGDVHADTPDKVVQTWQSIKAEERRQRGEPIDPPITSPLDKLPHSMPILTRVAQVLSKSSATRSNQPNDKLAKQLLAAVEAVVAAGLDPERELERAFRERSQDGIVNG
jgi:tetrapyrrole methylase family protein/MazG family protein